MHPVEGSCTFFADPRWRTVGSSQFLSCTHRQQLILACLPLYIEMGHSLRCMGTFGRFFRLGEFGEPHEFCMQTVYGV